MDRFLIKSAPKSAQAASTSTDSSGNERHHQENQECQNELELEQDEQKTSKKPPKAKQKLRKIWFEKFSWMEKKIGSDGLEKPFCKFCHKMLTNNIVHINRHESSDCHKNIIKTLKNQTHIFTKDQAGAFTKKLTKIKIAEMQIIMFLLQHNLSFVLISPLILLIKAIATTDSSIVKELKCGKTKATETTNSLFLNEGVENIAKILRNQKFSIIIDETTDVSTKKCLVLVVRFFDYTLGKVCDKFFGLIQLDSCDAKSIYDEIMNYFNRIKVPIINLIGFASDNASVMMGNKGGVKTLFKQINPNLYVMGCICHSLHLCSSAAAKKIPQNLEFLARNIYFFFSHSAKRITEYKEFQEYFNIKSHKILKTASTRWLSLENVVSRILEQWVALKHYFISYQLESNADLAHNIFLEMTDENKIYFLFLLYILKITNKINIEYQAETPKIHILLPTIKIFFKTILSNFIKPEFINDFSLSEIDFLNEECFLDISQVYIGAKADIIISNGSIALSSIYSIKKCCRDYYVELCKEIKKRIKFNDEVLVAVQCINPNSKAPSLAPLIKLFPNLIDEQYIDDLDDEWRNLLNQDIVDKNLNIENFWKAVFNLKNGINETMYPNLKMFIGSILCFPHSSATAERVFSQVNLIKDKKRNCLLTTTVNAILMSKELLGISDASQWMPSKDLINEYHK